MSDQDQTQSRSPLESERGVTTVQSGVVSKIAGVAANEVEGIRMGGSASRALGDFFGGSSSSQDLSRGISVDVGRVEAAIEVTMEVEYGRSIIQLTERLRDRITERVENLTGLRISRFNVTVNDVVFPEGVEGGASPRRDDDTTQSLQTEQVRTGRTSGAGGRESGSTDVAAAGSEAVTQAGSRAGEETARRRDEEDQTTEIAPEEESRRERRRRRREGR